ncbi:hypothetical protein Syun_013292 [Stephania yunnanensis]|uniref:non-specific serine/threonine protein kinase n=1 Tax=Stephania yunnanensis TaxID=152371 RepID=A0AAP0K122_9MAGN
MAFISCFVFIVSLLWGFSANKSLMSCSASKIMLGSKLVAGANQAWISDNRTFAFGFTPNESKDLFYLSIWYNELPGDRVEVWTANRNSPVGKDATLELETAGNLLLTDRAAAVWCSNTSSRGVAAARISDSGNLILLDSDSHPIWQSFSHPSHTLLPNQPLNVSLELTTQSHLGFYTLKMLQQTNSLSLGLTFNSPESGYPSPETGRNYSYWSVPEISNVTGEVYAVVDEKGDFGIVYGEGSGGVVYVHKNDESNKVFDEMPVLRRLTLEANGNLRLYRWDDDVNGSRQWVAEWAAVSNPCDIAGVCGNGVCRLKGSKTNASCSCLPGTSQCLGNNRSLVGDCGGDQRKLAARLRIATVNLTNYYYDEASVIANYSDVATTAKCGDACLSDCNCVASVYGLKEEKAYCWILRRLEFGGFEDPTSTLFVKVRNDGSSAASEGGDGGSGGGDHREKTLVIPIVLCMSVLIGLLCFLLYYTFHGKKALKNAIKGSLMVSGAPVNFSYRDLQSATTNFSHLLGTGKNLKSQTLAK